MTAIKTKAAKTVKERDAKLKAHFVKLLPADNRTDHLLNISRTYLHQLLNVEKEKNSKTQTTLGQYGIKKVPNR